MQHELLHTRFSASISQVQCQADQTCVGGHTESSQDQDGISAGTEFVAVDAIFTHLGEELSVPLRAAEEADDEDAGTVDGEQSTDTVEFGGEDLEHDEGEGKL